MSDNICDFCGEVFSDRVYFGHVAGCPENPANKPVKTEIVKIAVQDKELEEKSKPKVARKRK
jgi:hypothetical protein